MIGAGLGVGILTRQKSFVRLLCSWSRMERIVVYESMVVSRSPVSPSSRRSLLLSSAIMATRRRCQCVDDDAGEDLGNV